MCKVGGARRLARQTAKKAVERENKGALGMSKDGFAALQDDADDGSIQRCQLRRLGPIEGRAALPSELVSDAIYSSR